MCLALRRDVAVGLLGLVALASPAAVVGQVLTTVEFSFSNPGARSMGFGGAFVALADDATAAFANPAGLVQLVRSEVSAEGRSWSYATPYTGGGRAAGSPTGIGIDNVAGPLTAEAKETISGISFLSFVYPKRNWSLAVFQPQVLNFELSQEIQGLFVPGLVFEGTFRGPIERGSLRQKVVTRGLAVGVRVSEKLNLGLGLSHFDPTIVWTGREYLPDDDTQESYFAEASFLPDRLEHVFSGEAEDGDWGVSAGFLWTLSARWKLGGAYRQGPEFRLDGHFEAGPANPFLPPGFVERGATPWIFPDVCSLGIAYRSEDGRWTGSFEWDRVEYSIIVESLDPSLTSAGDVVDDADELRFGGEYAFLGSTPLFAVRLGLWHDPDHRIRNDSQDPFNRAELPPGEDVLHFAVGFGVAFRAFQIDLGVDLSERVDTAAISAIYSF
jgi:long-subunit fatty acid transport protein